MLHAIVMTMCTIANWLVQKFQQLLEECQNVHHQLLHTTRSLFITSYTQHNHFTDTREHQLFCSNTLVCLLGADPLTGWHARSVVYSLSSVNWLTNHSGTNHEHSKYLPLLPSSSPFLPSLLSSSLFSSSLLSSSLLSSSLFSSLPSLFSLPSH